MEEWGWDELLLLPRHAAVNRGTVLGGPKPSADIYFSADTFTQRRGIGFVLYFFFEFLGISSVLMVI